MPSKNDDFLKDVEITVGISSIVIVLGARLAGVGQTARISDPQLRLLKPLELLNNHKGPETIN